MWKLKVFAHNQVTNVVFEYGKDPVVDTSIYTYNNVRVNEDGELEIDAIAKEPYHGTYNCTAYVNVNGSNQTCGTPYEFNLEVTALCK